MSEIFVTIFELVGTVAFSISGAIVAIEKKMDMFGVAILGLIAATGGGVMRDVIIGNTPPQAFSDPIYLIVAILTALVVFLPPVRKRLDHKTRGFEISLLVMDSLGLAVFTVVGIAVTEKILPDSSGFLLVFVGVLTGVGGGVMRDVIAGITPYIFVKHFYATASIIGAVICFLLWKYVDHTVGMVLGGVVILILRLLAARFRWELPRAE